MGNKPRIVFLQFKAMALEKAHVTDGLLQYVSVTFLSVLSMTREERGREAFSQVKLSSEPLSPSFQGAITKCQRLGDL